MLKPLLLATVRGGRRADGDQLLCFLRLQLPDGPREAAVLAHAPEMNDGEQDDRCWQHGHVENIEAKQRSFPDGVAAEQQFTQLAANDRSIAADVGADRDGPVGQLIPGQQISGKGEPKSKQQQ